SREKFAIVATAAAQAAAAPHLLLDSDLGRTLGVTDDVAGRMVLAAIFLSAALDEPNSLDELVSRRIVDATVIPSINKFFDELKKQQKAIKDNLSDQGLASAVLPTFSDLSLTADMRFRFDGDQVVRRTPVAIGYLTTDIKDQRLWFQISKPQID